MAWIAEKMSRNKRLQLQLFILILVVLVLILLSLMNNKLSPLLGRNIIHFQDFHTISKNQTQYGKCLPHKPSEDSIKLAQKLYYLDPSLTHCKPPLGKTICRIEPTHERTGSQKDTIQVHCNPICKEQSTSDNMTILTVRDGKITSVGSFQSRDDLQKGLVNVIAENIKKKIHFVVLRCTLKDSGKGVSQLLPLDPHLTNRRNTTKSRDKNLINVNILLSDSVSRAHFHRSLPKTIEVFRKWTNASESAPARVFDFELFQAVEGHTTENTHGLFNGKLLPLERTSGRHSVHPGTMFGAFHKAGYQTMWQEDLCWTAVWGLRLDLIAGSWNDLQEKLQENFIDHVVQMSLPSCAYIFAGLTDATCEILEYVYGVNHPFYKPKQICYSGRLGHSYYMNYTLDTIRAIASDPHALPLFTYMALNVGHDDLGRRIQTLDNTLVEYVSELAVRDDTITIMLADHGNTYTRYTVSVSEGRFEIFHPHLFIIIPNKVADRLGKEALDALAVNQYRLVNVIDLHNSIMALTEPLTGRVSPRGIFAPISANRTCNDMELRMPNLCVCEGWDTPTSKDDMKIALVEFAVGMLNDQLDEQLIKHAKEANRTLLPRSCIRLRAVSYDEVRIRRDSSRNALITSMLLYVADGDLKGKETFNVQIESRDDPSAGRSLDIKLTHFDRMSMYGPYGACADKGVDLKLCMCQKGKKSKSWPLNVTDILAPPSSKYLGDQSVSRVPDDQSDCLYLISRSHKSISFAYELANICERKEFAVSVDVVSKGIKLSRSCPFKETVRVGTVKFILSARLDNLKSKGTSSIKVEVKVLEVISL